MGKENDELWQFACQDMGPSGAQLAILNLSCFYIVLLDPTKGGGMSSRRNHGSIVERSTGRGAWMQDITEAQLWFDHLTFDEEQAQDPFNIPELEFCRCSRATRCNVA